MKCEHAQEFFSDYVEKSLDKPTEVTLEAHLTACAGCRRDLEGLQQTWQALNAVPAVEPPTDFAWRVVCRLQQERLEQLEAQRKRPNPFVAWLHSLTPGSAFGYATLVAILFVAIAFPLRGPIESVIFGLFGSPSTPISQPVPPLAPRVDETFASFAGTYQDAGTGQTFYRLIVTLPESLDQARVTVDPLIPMNGQLSSTGEREHAVVGGQQVISIPVAVGSSPVQAVLMRVHVPGQRPFVKYLNVPAY
jgi:hypothetical protein